MYVTGCYVRQAVQTKHNLSFISRQRRQLESCQPVAFYWNHGYFIGHHILTFHEISHEEDSYTNGEIQYRMCKGQSE